MSDITLSRQDLADITEADRLAVRRVLFGVIDGLGEHNRKRWRRFMGTLLRLAPGELVDIKTHKARHGPFHRMPMLLETRVFEAQERIEAFDDFRLWLKVGAGFVTWAAGPRGGVFPVPRSIAFDKLEEDDMRQFHEDAVALLRTLHAIKYPWPKLSEA